MNHIDFLRDYFADCKDSLTKTTIREIIKPKVKAAIMKIIRPVEWGSIYGNGDSIKYVLNVYGSTFN